jgi:hypothetical protein
MNWTDAIFQVALIILPAGAVLFTSLHFLRRESEKEVRNVQIELKKQRQDFFLPNRVEAYQRSVLFLERIHPNSLVMRLHNPALPAKMMQSELLKAIRDEYDHNVAQQIFIAPQIWDVVKNSKEETIKILNIAGNQMNASSMATDLAAKIFEVVSEIGELPTDIAVKIVKEDLQKLF